jgi:hypothetical protein
VSPSPIYIIDTSALIDLQDFYPRETFPSLWELFEDLAENGKLLCPREVSRELEKKSTELKEWIEGNDMVLSASETVDLAEKAADIDRKYPELKTGRRRRNPNPRSADPWVVALASKKNGVVVSSEHSQPAAQKIRAIPDACRVEGIKWLSLLQLFQELGVHL